MRVSRVSIDGYYWRVGRISWSDKKAMTYPFEDMIRTVEAATGHDDGLSKLS